MTWQPIETAPRDGSLLLLSNGGSREIGFYLTEEEARVTEGPNAECLEPGWYTIEYHHPEFDEYYWPTAPLYWQPQPPGEQR